jgi:hypothetical protein
MGQVFSAGTSVFSFYQSSTLIFIYMFLLLEGQAGKAWEPSNKAQHFGNREALDRKIIALFFKG